MFASVQDYLNLEERVDKIEQTVTSICADMKWVKYLLLALIASVWGVGAL